MAADKSPFPRKPEKRSPFPRPSLPQAGDSLREELNDLVLGKFFGAACVAVTLIFVAVHGWVMWWLGITISPGVWTLGAAAVTAVALWQFFRNRTRLRTLLQAIRGERQVGRMLEEMRELGYQVFHDIPGNAFNVDHALIGPGGIFAVETKTWSKPGGRKAIVEYDGTRVLADGHAPDRDPVTQAAAVADHLRDILKRMTDREVSVRPVVLFPGWWVNTRVRDPRVWVLNPKSLRAFLENENNKLTREDIALYADRLTLHLSAD